MSEKSGRKKASERWDEIAAELGVQLTNKESEDVKNLPKKTEERVSQTSQVARDPEEWGSGNLQTVEDAERAASVTTSRTGVQKGGWSPPKNRLYRRGAKRRSSGGDWERILAELGLTPEVLPAQGTPAVAAEASLSTEVSLSAEEIGELKEFEKSSAIGHFGESECQEVVGESLAKETSLSATEGSPVLPEFASGAWATEAVDLKGNDAEVCRNQGVGSEVQPFDHQFVPDYQFGANFSSEESGQNSGITVDEISSHISLQRSSLSAEAKERLSLFLRDGSPGSAEVPEDSEVAISSSGAEVGAGSEVGEAGALAGVNSFYQPHDASPSDHPSEIFGAPQASEASFGAEVSQSDQLSPAEPFQSAPPEAYIQTDQSLDQPSEESLERKTGDDVLLFAAVSSTVSENVLDHDDHTEDRSATLLESDESSAENFASEPALSAEATSGAQDEALPAALRAWMELFGEVEPVISSLKPSIFGPDQEPSGETLGTEPAETIPPESAPEVIGFAEATATLPAEIGAEGEPAEIGDRLQPSLPGEIGKDFASGPEPEPTQQAEVAEKEFAASDSVEPMAEAQTLEVDWQPPGGRRDRVKGFRAGKVRHPRPGKFAAASKAPAASAGESSTSASETEFAGATAGPMAEGTLVAPEEKWDGGSRRDVSLSAQEVTAGLHAGKTADTEEAELEASVESPTAEDDLAQPEMIPHRAIPSWEETVGIIIAWNLEHRSKHPEFQSRRNRGN